MHSFEYIMIMVSIVTALTGTLWWMLRINILKPCVIADMVKFAVRKCLFMDYAFMEGVPSVSGTGYQSVVKLCL